MVHEPLVRLGTAANPFRILLVEDRQAYGYLVRDMLIRNTALNAAVALVTSLTAALEYVTTTRPDSVLLDLGLPDSFGFQTYARLREAAPTLPIVVMTAVDDEELARRTVRQGAQDFLRKDDITPGLLARTLTYATERARSTAALHTLSANLLRLRDDERRRVGHDLHEVTHQKLAALSMELAIIERSIPPGQAAARQALEVCKSLAVSCSREVSAMTCMLHTPVLDELGLTGAIRELADCFAERCGIVVDLEISERWPPLDEGSSLTLYRVLQEALENVHRHAHSRTASIRLNVADNLVVLDVEDAGCGFPPDALDEDGPGGPSWGVGIMGMKERMLQLGGRLRINSSAHGTLVRATLPIPGGVR
jgi:signal transduction histidine kinase